MRGLIYCRWANGAENNKFKRGEYYPIDEIIEMDPVLDYHEDQLVWVLDDLRPDPVFGVMVGGVVAIFEVEVLEA